MSRTTSLTLSRYEGEVLIIDHDIRVIVQRARNGQAKITIEAPEEVDVFREELEGGVIPAKGQPAPLLHKQRSLS